MQAFSDYHWDLQQLFTKIDPLAARFIGSSTRQIVSMGIPATGRVVTTSTFAFHRRTEAEIVEVWVTADVINLLNQLEIPRWGAFFWTVLCIS